MSRVRSVRAWGPSTGPTACALAGWRCSLWGWQKGFPGGGAFHHGEGRLGSGAVPPPTARPLGGLLGSASHVLWARVCGCGGPTLSPWPACPVGAACRGGGGGPSSGGVACHRCEGRLVSGAVPPPAACPLERAAGVPRPVCPGCGRCGRGDPAPAPQRAPLRAGIARCGGGGRASLGGVHSTILRGVWGQTLSLPRLPAHWAGCWGRPPTCCGRGCVGVGAQHCPLGLHALWGLHAAGVVGGRPRGGVACHRCEGRLVSGAVPPPVARPLQRAAWVPRPVCPGCSRCGRGDPAPAPRRAPLRAGVARCGGGGRASPGGVPSTIMRGVWGQALSLPRLPTHWAGCRGSFSVCGVCGVRAVRVVVRGAALPLFLWCSPLRCLGAVLCSLCACRAAFPVRATCSAAGYPLFLSWLRCSLPFPLPFSLTCTFSLPPLCCVSRSFSLPARHALPLCLLL